MKQKGGAFYLRNLYVLLEAQYRNAQLPPGYNFIDSENPKLKTERGLAWAIICPENCHVIIIHRGTLEAYDWGNNLRMPITHFPDGREKIFSGHKQTTSRKAFVSAFSTDRAIIAAEIHSELKTLVEECIHQYSKGFVSRSALYHCVKNFIEREIAENGRSIISRIASNSITLREKFLKQHLSTIGHSQGALYCYAHGDDGFETVVFNPAPGLPGRASLNNLHVIRVHDDFISGDLFFTTGKLGSVRDMLDLKSAADRAYQVSAKSFLEIPNKVGTRLGSHLHENLLVDERENALVGNNALFEPPNIHIEREIGFGKRKIKKKEQGKKEQGKNNSFSL